MAVKVTLRKKAITGNRESLYLDFYPAVINPETGEATRREFLNRYVFKPLRFNTKKTGELVSVFSEEKREHSLREDHNRETLIWAEKVRQKREAELNKPEVYNQLEKKFILEEGIKRKQQESSFLEYFEALSKKRMGSNYDNWNSSLIFLKRFAEVRNGGDIKFGELNLPLINQFREFLQKAPTTRSYKTKLAQNSQVAYFTKLKVALKMAFKEGFIQEDINSKVEGIKHEETERAFLTLEELNQLVKTECNIPALKKACLFAALTGLRWSDCEKLTWGEIESLEGGSYRIKYTQKKTGSPEYLPVSKQAVQILGEPGKHDERPFAGLKYSAYTNSHITQWIAAAGIKKKITFHNFRHTYATLQLERGTDIFTVSKLLGHKNLKTTQIYAKVVDKLKQEAAERIQLQGLDF